MPSIKVSSDSFKDEIVTESGVIVHFLADSQHSHLFPSPSSSASALLFRARVNFFTDTWNSKIAPLTAPILRLDDSSEKEARCKELAQTIGKEIEPLLEGANPFFAGSQSMTLAEVSESPVIPRPRFTSCRYSQRPFSFGSTPCQTMSCSPKCSRLSSTSFPTSQVGATMS